MTEAAEVFPINDEKLAEQSLISLKAELAIRLERKAQAKPGGLVQFVRYFWNVLEPETKLVEGWLLDDIAMHLEAITLGVERFKLDKEVARAVFAVDDTGSRRERAEPENRKRQRHDPPQVHAASRVAIRSATRSTALRARGLAAISAADGFTALPTSRNVGRTCAGI